MDQKNAPATIGNESARTSAFYLQNMPQIVRAVLEQGVV